MSAANIEPELITLFGATLSPDPATRKSAEARILAAHSQPGFAPALLSIVASSQNAQQQGDKAAAAARLAATIDFKNLCKAGWNENEERDESSAALINEQDKAVVREKILPILFQISSSSSSAGGGNAAGLSSMRSALEEAVAIIAEVDFPDKWPTLIDSLVQGILPEQADQGILMGTLQLSHSIFKRWRAAFRSNALFTTINIVLGKLADPFLALMQRTDAALTAQGSSDKAVITALAEALDVEIQIFYDLSCQDLPPQFEDNLDKIIAPILLRHLSFTRAELQPPAGEEEDDTDAQPGPLERIRAGVCEVSELYAQRYLDVFGKHLPAFIQAVWQMLSSSGKSQRYDSLVNRGIGLLSTVVKMGNQKEMFDNSDTLRQFVEAIILPNVELRESDEELLEDNPMEYIRRDFEVSTENDTRRKAAADFTRALMQHFGQTVTGIMEQYIGQYLQAYRSNPSANWKQKDTAIYLLTSIAVGGSTQLHGVSSVNALIDVVQFFSDNVFSDLQAGNDGSVHPILQIDAIKFLHTFRNQLTREQLLSVLPLLVHHLESGNYVTCSYAAISIERILFMKSQPASNATSATTGTSATPAAAQQPLFSPEDVKPFTETILMACFRTIMSGSTPEKIAENDHLMKCVMRLIITSRHAIVPVHTAILQQLTAILDEIAKNPSNPKFNQFVFESISALIRSVTLADPSALPGFEQALFGPFTTILQNDVSEFTPFVFQILAQMLEKHAGTQLPEAYIGLLPPLLTPTLWEQRGNVPALVRLFQSFLARGSQSITANNQLNPIMAIYQRLISSRINDTYGFELLQSVFENVPDDALAQYRRPVLTLMLTRLQSSRTDKFSKGFVYFVSFLSTLQKQGYPAAIISAFDEVQPGLFSQLLGGVIAPELAKMPTPQKRVALVGTTRLITEAPAMLQPPNVASLPAVLKVLLPAILQPSEAVDRAGDNEDEIYALDWEEQGFQASYSQLAASQSAKRDPAAFAGANIKVYLLQQLASASPRAPGVLAQAIQAAGQDVSSKVAAEMQAAGLALS